MNRRFFVIFLSAYLFFPDIPAGSQTDTTGVSKLFHMSLLDLMNQEIVTSAKFNQRSQDAGSSVSVITADEILYYNYSTLGEALNSQRGMYLSNDKNYIYVGSRGFSRPTDYNNRIVIMLDGHIMNEVVYGSAFMDNSLGINLKNTERIEIVRGPGASVYGSGAMLNTINLISKKGLETNGVQIDAGTGSFGRNELSLIYGKEKSGYDYTVSGNGGVYKGENYYFPELAGIAPTYGISKGLDWERHGNLQARLKKGDFYFSGLISTRVKGIPTGAFDTDLSKDDYTIDNRYFLESGYRKDYGNKGYLLLRGYYDEYYYRGSYPTEGIGIYDRSYGTWVGGEAQYLLKKRDNIFTSGLEYKQIFTANYKEWSDTAAWFDKNFPFTVVSLYAQDQYTFFNKLIFTAGLRYDAYSGWKKSLSPRLSAVYSYAEASSLKLLYNEAFRAPNIYEAYYASKDSHKNNPLIKPEKMQAAELAWGHSFSDQIYTSFSVYYNNIFDLIELTLDSADNLTTFINVGEAHGYGIESEFRYQPARGGGGFINISLQRSKDAKTGRQLSNSPGALLKSGVIIPFGKRVFLSPEFYYESGRYTLKENTTGDAFLFNLSLRLAGILKHFDVTLKARNIFSFKYSYPGGFEHLQDAIIQDSRSLFLQLSARF